MDFFVPSAEELCYMLDRERFYQWQERARGGDVTQILDPEEDIRPLAEMCMDMGCQILLIKCGAPGMYFKTADRPSSGTALLQSGDGSRTVGRQGDFRAQLYP